ncbi:MAG: hypothetical protein VYE73_16795 [Acidobacteriota bacterium]|nr:hypothetical protein [Acidobacteriota bacterium]
MRRNTILFSTLLLLAGVVAPLTAAEADVARTPSGKPDLSGTYDVATLTPMQRDPKFGERVYLTQEEADAIASGAEAREARGLAPSDPDRTAPPAGGNIGAYNSFYFDRGSGAVMVDGKYRTSLLTDPPNGRFPPLTDKGKARREGLYSFMGKNSAEVWWQGQQVGPYDGPETFSIADRCIYSMEATIPILSKSYNNIKTIVQTDDYVMIHIEWMSHARIIRIGSEHLPEGVRSRSGDSVGWWEGDTLVVDTTNFLEEKWYTTTLFGEPSPAEDQRVVERLTPVEGGDLHYEFSVTTSDYTAPYTGSYTWPATESRAYEYACLEGNYAMGNSLRGARFLEREAASSGR